jgi:aminopeptidase
VDPRLDRLAELIVGYSLALQPRDVFRIEGGDVAEESLLALYRAGLRAGAFAYFEVGIDRLAELMIAEGSDEQLDYVSRIEWDELEQLDAVATVWAEPNTRSLTNADPERSGRYLAARRSLSRRGWERIAAGDLRWCGTLAPVFAYAQDAELPLVEYEQFVYGACHVLDGQDPVAHWQEMSAQLTRHAERLADVRELRILGPDTDLRVGVGDRRWQVADGKTNMPDGEIFTSPVETGTSGQIYFAFPSVFQGQEVENVRLRFEDGRVVHAEASSGESYLRSLLDTDPGARVLGEVAFGLNYEIDRFTRDILFDEKIGGTMHVALGGGFDEAGTENKSDLHWDLICDLREEGEVYADGELVWKAGAFISEPAGERV